MRMRSQLWLVMATVAVSLSGCSKGSGRQENLNAVLWVQTSSEYAATTTGIYAAATTTLENIVATTTPVTKPIRFSRISARH
jgi:hypothetical protein